MKLLETLKSLTFFPTLIQGPVDTNPFSNENGAALPRIRLSSTLQRRKRSPKTEPFENALQSGAIWKRCFLKTLFSNVDEENDAIWKRWRHQNRHDRAPDHHDYPKWRSDATMWLQFRANLAGRYIEMRMRRIHLSMHAEGMKAFSKRIRRCSVYGRKRYENDKCRRNSFWKRNETVPFIFVWKRIIVDRARVNRIPPVRECWMFIHVLNLVRHVVLYYFADTFYWSRQKKPEYFTLYEKLLPGFIIYSISKWAWHWLKKRPGKR